MFQDNEATFNLHFTIMKQSYAAKVKIKIPGYGKWPTLNIHQTKQYKNI